MNHILHELTFFIRIRSFFCLWLSQYWGDFKSSVTRRMMIQFLERISSYDSLSSVCDVLLPLAIREPAICDKDSYWGMCDDDNDKSRKKDSGYNESFGDWIGHDLNHHHKNMIIKKRPIIATLSCSIRRAVSTNSHQKIPVSFRSLVELADQQDRRNSIPLSNHDEKRYGSQSCSAVFGGGLISVLEQKFLAVDPFQVITSLSPYKLAEQLTWIEAELFRKIQPRDFLRHLWSQRKKKSRSHSPNKNPVLASIEHFNFISGWIASLVVNQTVLEKRVVVFEFCLQTAVVR